MKNIFIALFLLTACSRTADQTSAEIKLHKSDETITLSEKFFASEGPKDWTLPMRAVTFINFPAPKDLDRYEYEYIAPLEGNPLTHINYTDRLNLSIPVSMDSFEKSKSIKNNILAISQGRDFAFKEITRFTAEKILLDKDLNIFTQFLTQYPCYYNRRARGEIKDCSLEQQRGYRPYRISVCDDYNNLRYEFNAEEKFKFELFLKKCAEISNQLDVIFLIDRINELEKDIKNEKNIRTLGRDIALDYLQKSELYSPKVYYGKGYGTEDCKIFEDQVCKDSNSKGVSQIVITKNQNEIIIKSLELYIEFGTNFNNDTTYGTQVYSLENGKIKSPKILIDFDGVEKLTFDLIGSKKSIDEFGEEIEEIAFIAHPSLAISRDSEMGLRMVDGKVEIDFPDGSQGLGAMKFEFDLRE